MNSTPTDPDETATKADSFQEQSGDAVTQEDASSVDNLDLDYLSELLETNYTIEAKTLLRLYLESPDKKANGLFRAAELFMKYQIVDIAEVAYRAILDIDANNVSVLGRLGDIAQQKGDNSTAVKLFRQIIKNEPVPENWVYIGLGNALEATGEIAEAISSFKKAISTSTYKRELSVRIENLQKKLGQIQKSAAVNKVIDQQANYEDYDAHEQGSHRKLVDFAIGFLEGASVSALTGEAVVVGWIKTAPDVIVWLENNDGEKISLNNAFRFDRQDVDAVHGSTFGHIAGNAGFLIRLTGIKLGEKVRLVAGYGDQVLPLGETQCNNIGGTSLAAARWLFGLVSPVSQMQHRLKTIDVPMIEAFLNYEREVQSSLPVQEHQLGKAIENPLVSIIIPLYGRIDFVESQLLEFSRDTWLQANAEIIYVIDDPKIFEGFFALAENLYRLYRLPFKWIWGHVNRGFSGANNLGAEYAQGKNFLFLNSDVFPQQPGWLQALIDVLEDYPDIGAVGPRLVFANGSIQHAGMSFMRREELGIWVNHHPYMGLDPSLDPAKALTQVPAVTGACLAMRRSEFERIGGWDTGYLIGDFEDSDLCLKLRSVGFYSAYLPTVQLTHLERQSFKLLGQDDFRFRVVIFNAVRHQSRWQQLIETLATPQ